MKTRIAYSTTWPLILYTTIPLLAVFSIAFTSMNEINDFHKLLSFCFFVSSFIIFISITGYILTSSATVSWVSIALHYVNEMKFEALREVIHPIDALLLYNWMQSDLSLIKNYPILAFFTLMALCVIAFTLFILVGIDRRSAKHLRSPQTAAIFSISLVTSGAIAQKAGHLPSVGSLQFYSQLSANTGIRPSYLVASIRQMATMKAEMALHESGGAVGVELNLSQCIDCPDLVIYHVESVFEPNMIDEYSNDRSIGNKVSSALNDYSGLLETSIYGGRSMISEFELLCGTKHKSLGFAGNYPNLFLRPFIGRCAPQQLVDLGYESTVLYTTPYDQNHAGSMFRAYGFNEFRDSRVLELPERWDMMRDTYLVNEAIRLLRQPRNKPRLLFVSTMFNHGPHGNRESAETFREIFSLELAKNDEVKDYVNRLNHSIAEMERLEKEIASLPNKTAILYYGDHQPNLSINYASRYKATFGELVQFITFYRIAMNWGEKIGKNLNELKPVHITKLSKLYLDMAMRN
jgi:hypothetical protein